MQVHFSVGGQIYPGEPIIFRPPEDRIFENSRNISVKLHHRVGRFVKLRLSFPAPPARWILISEVSFRSEPAARNYTTEVDGSPVTPPASSPPVSSLPLPPSGGGQEVWANNNADTNTNGKFQMKKNLLTTTNRASPASPYHPANNIPLRDLVVKSKRQKSKTKLSNFKKLSLLVEW